MSDTEERIPWFRMPLMLRALPFDERKQALLDYEAKNGPYVWESHFPH